MEDQEIREEIPQEPQDAPVSAEETILDGAEETESPPVDDQEDGPDAAAQAQEAERQTKVRESRGVQKRIDELVKQREEANRRVDYLMGLVAQVSQGNAKPGQQEAPQAPVEPQPPREEDYKSYEDYLEAKTDYKATKAAAEAERKVLAQVNAVMDRDRQARQQEVAQRQARSWADAGTSKYADFGDVVMADDLRISPAMRDVILTDPAGHDVAYWLGKNPDVTAKISALPPLRQAQELGRIAARFEGSQQSVNRTQKTTSAPPPVRPSGSRGTVSKDPGRMSMDEYRTWRMAQKG